MRATWPFLGLGFVLVLMAGSLSAVTTEQTIAIKTVEKPLFGSRLKPVRVRIGVEYQRFEAILTKGKDGKAHYQTIPSRKIVHTLNSRLEQQNHFYFGGLHVETHPLSWSRETGKYKVRLDIYRTYGMHGELEEKLGELVADGELKGEGRLFNFLGTASAEFKNPQGLKTAKITVTTPRFVQQPMISKLDKNVKK